MPLDGGSQRWKSSLDPQNNFDHYTGGNQEEMNESWWKGTVEWIKVEQKSEDF